MARFAFTGITGKVGRHAASLLLASGNSVRAVVRNEESAQTWKALGAEAALAQIDDANALTTAFADTDGVYVMTPTWFEADDMFAENRRAVAALSQALRAAKPAKVILLSSVGAQHAHGTGAILKLNHMEVAFADIPGVTALRAAWFMENFAGLIDGVAATGRFASMLAPLDRPVPMVATKDIGVAVAELLQRGSAAPPIVELEGPRRYTPRDVADAFSSVLGRPVEAEILPLAGWSETYRSWGLSPNSVEAMSEMLSGFNDGHVVFERHETETDHGATSLETVLADLPSPKKEIP